MDENEIYCENCDRVIAPDWTLSYCPMCGGNIGPATGDRHKKTRNTSGKPNKPKQKKPEKLRVRTKLNDESRPAALIRSEAFDTLRQTSPAGIFIANILTFGLRSFFWMIRRMPSLKDMAREDEHPRKSALYLCSATYAAVIILVIAACRELYLLDWDISVLSQSLFPRAALGAALVSFVAGKHMLFWAREVIADAVGKESADTISAKAESFAPSPFMLWFRGVPYLQLYLNDVVRARNLAYFKSSKHRTP
jgi:hypothetical protein